MLIEQRSPEWHEIRKGKITSSEFHKIMGDGKVRESYLLEKISEGFGGFSAPATGVALEWGTDLEDMAREIYQARTGYNVEKCSFIVVDEYYGGSPDALVNPGGCIEIKCPYGSANHFKHGLITSDTEFKKAKPDYYYQCMSHMLVSGAEWCDFISFDPRVHADYIMFVYRLNRNEEEIKVMKAKLESAIEFIQETKSKLPKFIKNQENTVTLEG